MDHLRQDEDAWVATASRDGLPTLVPLSFLWEDDRGTLLMCTRRTNPTAVNVASRPDPDHTRPHPRCGADRGRREGTGANGPADRDERRLRREVRMEPARPRLGVHAHHPPHRARLARVERDHAAAI